MKAIKYLLLLMVLGGCRTSNVWQVSNNFQYKTDKQVECHKGAVVSAHPLASLAGLKMLQLGGNAVDAAIATQWALAVVYPGAGNIGGGGFMVAQLKDGSRLALDYRETAPLLATKNMYLDSNGNPIVSLSLDGHLSVGVPGTVAGLFESLQYAKLPMKTLIAPAIELAEKGFAITQNQANSFNNTKEDFLQNNKNPIAFVKNTNWKEGDTLRQPELANTLKLIRRLGARGFYEGETADKIVAEMKLGGGIINHQDLINYKAVHRDVIIFSYRGHEILSMPLPSSGGIILQQTLKMIEPFDIAEMGHNSPAAVQLVAEVERRAFADRAAFMGDPDFVKVPVKTITSKEYLKNRMMDYVPGVAGSSTSTKAGLVHESDETTHLSVIDNEGNAVAVTTTLNNNYGSKTVVSGAGFLLNDEMDDFSVKPGAPNLYGAVGNEKNAIAPGKRMLSSMTPTIVLKNNQPFLVVGTPGGTTIPTSVLQTILNIVDFKLNPSDAVNLPKFHHQWFPDDIKVEKEFADSTLDALQKMGYKTVGVPQIGRTELIRIIYENGKAKITAIGDHRGDDAAAGW